jgi:hypothetical protein
MYIDQSNAQQKRATVEEVEFFEWNPVAFAELQCVLAGDFPWQSDNGQLAIRSSLSTFARFAKRFMLVIRGNIRYL